jgi:hypothetical protein
MEREIPPVIAKEMLKRGHELEARDFLGVIEAVEVKGNMAIAADDDRKRNPHSDAAAPAATPKPAVTAKTKPKP